MSFRRETAKPDYSSLEGEYGRDARVKILFIVVCVVLVLVVAMYALTINGRGLGFVECVQYVVDHILGKQYLAGSDEWLNDYILWNGYFPRIFLGIFLGAGLAVCGVAMQAVMNNPLADSYTTGISDGACFGAVAAIVTGFTFADLAGSAGIIVNAFIGGLIPAIILILLSNFVRMSPATMILVGISLSYIFSGLESAIMVAADADSLKDAYSWQIGSLGDIVNWDKVYIPTVVSIVAMAVLWLLSGRLNLLALGDDSAKSLGLDVQWFKTVVMIIVSVCVAALVSYVGIIGFIGLLAPHLVRFFLGGNNRYVMPAAAAVGSLLILVSDLIARTIISPDEMRLGIIVSMIGAPVFLYIILARRKSYGEVFRRRCSGATRSPRPIWSGATGGPTTGRSSSP